MFKNKKRTYLILAIVIVALIVAGVLRKGSGTTTTKIVVATAELNDITESVSANGKIQPERDVIINSDVAGQIVDLFVKEGDTVPKGTLLLRINPDLFESALSRSEAALNNARAALATARARNTQSNAQFVQAQKSYDRNTNLHKSGAISDAEYEQAVSAFEVAKAEVEAAEQSVEAAKFNVASAQATRNEAADNLKRTSIFAPSDGIVSGLAKEKGESVLGTQQMSPTEIMHISDLNTMQVNVDVNESDIIRLSLGDTALIEVDAYLERKFKGVVTEIANAAKNVSAMSTDQVTNFQVKIRILKSSYEDLISEKSSWPFRPGMSATVEILTRTGRDLLTVPIEAVTTRSDTSSTDVPKFKKGDEAAVKTKSDKVYTCVFVHENGKAKLAIIETGIQDSKNIEIKSGLKEGQEVIRGPYDAVSRKLRNGSTVEKVSDNQLFTDKK
jgi:HlyD family secretion protein